MNCPYCDSRVRQVPDNRCCPNCGGPLAAYCNEEKKTDRPDEPDLESYYRRYRPDRIRAIMALRIDTGMDPMSAKTMIDYIFNYYDGPETE